MDDLLFRVLQTSFKNYDINPNEMINSQNKIKKIHNFNSLKFVYISVIFDS